MIETRGMTPEQWIQSIQSDAVAHGRELGLREAAEIIAKYPAYDIGLAEKAILSAINKKEP